MSEEDIKKDAENQEIHADENLVEVDLGEEMKSSYIDYSMSVIVGRALPDIRDGLKPVHRRILYAMNDMGMFHNKPFKKCARIVGEVLGKYHPHGDVAVYDSLVRMAQDFSLRYPLINGHGNFGSVDGDSAAAMRYTEAKLKRLAEEMLQDLEKNTVKMTPNFDESLKEPSVLPSKVPNLLINGSSGIAVGMATNIPPHNLSEIVDGTIAIIENPEIDFQELTKLVKGPDFPTGGIIKGISGIKSAYKTGSGKIRVCSKLEIDADGRRIIITEIPFQVKKAELIKEIAEKVKEGVIAGISDIRDESSSEGMRIIIDLKRDANPAVVKNQIKKHSRINVTFGINMLSLVEGEPKRLGLKEIMSEFIKHRQDVVRKRTVFDFEKAKEKIHMLEGLIIALKNIDEVIALIKKAKTVDEASIGLVKKYVLSKKQADAILQMRLQKLSSMEQQKIKEDYENTEKLIKSLEEILSSEEKILEIIKKELLELKEKYGDSRKTAIAASEEESLETEDLIKPKDVVITVSHQNYIKRTEMDSYRQQHRGGKGIIAAETKDDDFIEDIFIANTHDYMLFFTNKGNVHWLKVYEIPEVSRQSKGKAIINLIGLEKDENISSMMPVKEFSENIYLSIFTKKGIIKKTSLTAYSRPRKGGIKAIVLDENDEVVDVLMTSGKNELLIATKLGAAIKFNESDARPLGRVSRGVRAISLRKDDEVVSAIIAEEKKTVLTITEKGYGKRSKFEDYRLINRGGKGVINIKVTEKNGKVVSVKSVTDIDEMVFISKEGKLIRINVKDVKIIGRNTQGVRIMRLNEGDLVVSSAKIVEEQNGE